MENISKNDQLEADIIDVRLEFLKVYLNCSQGILLVFNSAEISLSFIKVVLRF